MDTKVGLVQAYLRLNDFFTMTVVAQTSHGGTTPTDGDVLGVCVPGAQRWVPKWGPGRALPTDPEVGSDSTTVNQNACCESNLIP